MNQQNQPTRGSRRAFLKTSAVAAGAVAAHAAMPGVFAAEDNTLKIGLIGCGGRGTGAAGQALKADKNVVLTAMADAFPDKLKASLNSLQRYGEKVKVDADHQFVGLDAYQKLIASDVDVVLLCSPPAFRPAHLKAAVAAGKHIFAEKPIATDAAGVRSVLESAAQAKEKNLAMVSGFCWRYSYPERAMFQRLHDGALGKIQTFYGTYNTGSLWMNRRLAGWSDLEWQMRNWLYFTWLSGDHLVEQCVHEVDKLAWTMLDKPPVRCWANGGRQQRTDSAYGHIYDHFSVVYEWPDDDFRGFIYCRQQDNCHNDVSNHLTGTKGIADINGFQKNLSIKGENAWKYDGPGNDMYQTEHDEMFKSIRDGKPINNGVRMATSTLMAIMGRMAGYSGKLVTWKQAMESKEILVPDRLEWGPIPTPAVPVPGRTQLG